MVESYAILGSIDVASGKLIKRDARIGSFVAQTQASKKMEGYVH